jgi:MoxR-like ATPase
MKISQIVPLLSLADNAGDAFCISGVHGLGKSEIVEQYAKENNKGIEIVFTSLFDEVDLNGMPDKQDGSVIFLEPNFITSLHDKSWPYCNSKELIYEDKVFETHITSNYSVITRKQLEKEYKLFYDIPSTKRNVLTTTKNVKVENPFSRKVVLFLDELNRAQQSVLNASLQLVLNKRLNEHELPSDTFVVTAINPSDDYQTADFDPALASRFFWTNVEVDHDGWLKWASDKKIKNVIRQFIAENEDLLHFQDDRDIIGTDPRKWAKLSKYIEDLPENIDKSVLLRMFQGKLGTVAGVQFFTYYNDFNKVVTLTEVKKLISKNKELSLEEIVTKVTELIEETEPILLLDWINELYKDSKFKNKLEDINFFALGYSIPVETLASFILEIKDKDMNKFLNFVNNDDDKGLVRKIKGKIVNAK